MTDRSWAIAAGRLAERLRTLLAVSRGRGRDGTIDLVGGLAVDPREPERLLGEVIREVGDDPGAPVATRLSEGLPTFARAAAAFGLDDLERDALFVALMPELDERFGRVFGFVNDRAVAGRPTVGLIARLLSPGRPAALRAFAASGALRRHELIVLDDAGPLASQAVALAPTLWPRLAWPDDPGAAPDLDLDLDALVLEPSVRAEADAVAAWWRTHAAARVIVEGVVGAGREALARAIVRRAARPLVAFAPPAAWPSAAELAREARWVGGAALLVEPPAALVEALATRAVPILVVTASAPTLGAIGSTPPTRIVHVGELSAAQRAVLWQRELPAIAPLAAARLARRFRLGPARIQEAAARARDREPSPSAATIEAAATAAASLRIEHLATPLPPQVDTELIVPAATRRELEVATVWAARRRELLAHDGPGHRLGLSPGLVCLFWGAPGTGKTLAARHLAAIAGVPLHRVDLSQVVSKYIGETEKHLAALLDESERGDIALLFDEADALFGKRTDVRDAHDRYANIETSFLLQRLEATSTLLVLTSNLHGNLDAAFARRVHVAAEFPAPAEAERLALWRALVPPAWASDGDVDLAFLSRCALRGGEIRNAIATALLARGDEGAGAVMAFLVWAAWRELTKAGRLVVAAEFGPWAPMIEQLARGVSIDAISR